MKEYIEREAIIKLSKEIKDNFAPLHRKVIDAFIYYADNNLPSADVAPVVHGKWIGNKYDWDNDYNPPEVKDSHYLVCSNCEHRHPLYNYNVWTSTLTRCAVFGDKITIPNYCPNCGAKMDGGIE
jgi:hypothetical protein